MSKEKVSIFIEKQYIKCDDDDDDDDDDVGR